MVTLYTWFQEYQHVCTGPWSFHIAGFPFTYKGKGVRADPHKLEEAISAPPIPCFLEVQ